MMGIILVRTSSCTTSGESLFMVRGVDARGDFLDMEFAQLMPENLAQACAQELSKERNIPLW